MKTLIFYNNKGGVAKTMTCVNLACVYANQGHKVLLVDLDPQANSTHFLLKDKASYPLTIKNLLDSRDTNATSIQEIIYPSDIVNNLDVIPAEADLDDAESSMLVDSMISANQHPKFYLAKYLEEVNEKYDLVLIDTHPSKKRLLNISGLIASDYVFIPVDSDPESFEGMNGLIETYRECLDSNPKLRIGGVIYTKYRNTNADIQALTILSETLVNERGESMLLDTLIPLRTKAVESRWEKVPMVNYAPNDDCSLGYVDLAREIELLIGGVD